MPSFNAHFLFSKEKLDFIKKTFPNVKINETALWYGSQGPDLMFFGRLMPVIMPGESLMEVGNVLHAANPTQILQAIKMYFKEHPEDDITLSFMIGFISHYVLDRNCHPFVYSREQIIWEDHKKWDRTWIHNVIEHNFDTYVIQRLAGVEKANKFVTYKYIPKDEDVLMGINRGFSYIVPRVSDVDIDSLNPKAGYYGAKDSHTIMFLLQDSTGLKTVLFGKLIDLFVKRKQGPMGTCFFVPKTPMTDYDYFNDAKKEWSEPRNPSFRSSENLTEIFDRAFKDFERILTQFAKSIDDDSIDMYAITEDHGFDTTLVSPKCENPFINMEDEALNKA